MKINAYFFIKISVVGAIKTACNIQIDGKCGTGRPKMSWKTLTETIVSGISTSLTLVKKMCGDQV